LGGGGWTRWSFLDVGDNVIGTHTSVQFCKYVCRLKSYESHCETATIPHIPFVYVGYRRRVKPRSMPLETTFFPGFFRFHSID
jgi:hypothetical protein